MNRLTGTGTLDYLGKSRQVHICLDLDANAIEVRHAMPNMHEAMSARQDWLTSPAVLINLRFSTPIGTLSKSRLDGFFVTSYAPGTWSIYDSTLARTLNFREKENGITKMVLCPRNSLVEFTFHPFDVIPPKFEMFYSGVNMSGLQPYQLQLDSARAAEVKGDKEGLAIVGDQPFLDREEFIRLSLGILNGGPVTHRSTLEGSALTINLISHDSQSLGHLHKKPADAKVLLQGIYDYLSSLSGADWDRWRTGIFFFLQGLGSTSALEIRTINFFTFLEVIDDNKTLCKETLSSLLGITTDEADLLYRVRNLLVHQGEHLGRAVLAAEKAILQYKTSLNNTVFPINRADEEKTGRSFYFAFARLLNKFWIQKAKFTGEWNDYSNYGF